MILFYTIILSSTFFLLGSRARITRPIWSRYPLPLANFMDCATCSGAWYSLVLGAVFLALGYSFPGLAGPHALIVCFFGGAAWTPIGAGVITFMMWQLGTSQHLAEETAPQNSDNKDPSE